jgi:PKD repeat protein
MKTKTLLGLAGLLALSLLISCSKDEAKPKPVAGFTASKISVMVGEEIQFTNTSVNATTYAWSFGDGTTSTEESPKKTYDAAGSYTVTLSATGAGGSNSSTQDITVNAASIYFMDSSDEILGKLVLDINQTVTTVKDLAGMSGVGIAYDDVHNKIYTSDFYDADTPDGKIWMMNFDGSSAVAIASGLLDPYAITLDLPAGKIYWVDDNGNVSRSDLDGSDAENGLVNIAGGGLRSIALDKKNNKMYFNDATNDVLYWANMDGTEVAPLLSGVYGYAICIDTVNHKMYYDEEYTPALMRANLDGTGIEEIYKNPDAAVGKSRIYGIIIDYDNDKLYWSNRDAGEIYRANLDGTSREVLKTGLTSPRGIFLKK